MKTAYLTPIFILLALPQFLFSQTNSVELKDGTGNLLSSHGSITDAYAAIPGILTQAYRIELTSSYDCALEIFPITFVAKGGASALNTITLLPAAGVTGITITGTVSSNGLLQLDDADYIVVDGRAGGTGTTRALKFDNLSTNTNSSGIQLINGACHNTIRYCEINGYATPSTGARGIYVRTSTSNPTGNSDNTFEFLKFEGPRYFFNASGTSGNPNRNLRIFGCEFVNISFCGWWQQAGTGKVTIDSSFFYCTGPAGSSGTGSYAILGDFQQDSTIVTRNHIYNMDNSLYTTVVYGMCFRSFNAGSYLEITNNFISLMAANSSSNTVIGIEFGTNSANNPLEAHVYHNTVRLGGIAVAGINGNLHSAPFSLDATNAGSVLDIRNNIFVNERTGGVEQHVAASYFTTNGTILSDDNLYFSATADFARIGTTPYPDLSAFQAVVFPNDTLSDVDTAFFVSATDLHLIVPSIGNPNFFGTLIPGVTTDFDGDFRVVPYRGADEQSGCFGIPQAGTISASDTFACAGDTLHFLSSGHASGMGITYQWQMAPAGTGNFVNIPGATDTLFSDSPIFSTDYRMIDSCAASGQIGISDTFTVNFIFAPTAFSISETHTGLDYSFTGNGVQNATAYLWDFGDGNTDTVPNPNHTYAANGNYTVLLIVSNACGSDTAELVITLTLGTPEESFGLDLFPNPAHEQFTVKTDDPGVSGMEIRDVSGKLMAQYTSAAFQQGQLVIAAENMKPGIYLVTIFSASRNYVRKLVVE